MLVLADCPTPSVLPAASGSTWEISSLALCTTALPSLVSNAAAPTKLYFQKPVTLQWILGCLESRASYLHNSPGVSRSRVRGLLPSGFLASRHKLPTSMSRRQVRMAGAGMLNGSSSGTCTNGIWHDALANLSKGPGLGMPYLGHEPPVAQQGTQHQLAPAATMGWKLLHAVPHATACYGSAATLCPIFTPPWLHGVVQTVANWGPPAQYLPFTRWRWPPAGHTLQRRR